MIRMTSALGLVGLLWGLVLFSGCNKDYDECGASQGATAHWVGVWDIDQEWRLQFDTFNYVTHKHLLIEFLPDGQADLQDPQREIEETNYAFHPSTSLASLAILYKPTANTYNREDLIFTVLTNEAEDMVWQQVRRYILATGQIRQDTVTWAFNKR